jgi:hypothetical protein
LKHLEGEGEGITTLRISDLRSPLSSNEIHFQNNRLSALPDKKYYFGLEFKKVNNPEFNNQMYYSIKNVGLDKQFYTPQINKISLQMPPAPPLYQWSDLPKVS